MNGLLLSGAESTCGGGATVQSLDGSRCCTLLGCLLLSFRAAAHVERLRASRLPGVDVAVDGPALARPMSCKAGRSGMLYNVQDAIVRCCRMLYLTLNQHLCNLHVGTGSGMHQRQSLSDAAGRQCSTSAYDQTLSKELDMRINAPAHRAKWIE